MPWVKRPDREQRFKDCRVANTRLRQSSAYDEMVAQPVRETANTLEVSLGGQLLIND